MTREKIKYLLAVSALGTAVVSAPVQAQSAQTKLGSAAFQSVRNCNTGLAATDNCMGPNTGPRIFTNIPGGPGQEVNSTVLPPSGGKIVSIVKPARLDLPVFKSGAWAGSNTRVASSLASYMGFRFNGPTGTPYALDALLDWTSSGAPLAYQEMMAGKVQVGEYGGEAIGNFYLYLIDAAFFPNITSAGDITALAGQFACGSPGVLAGGGQALITPTSGYHEATVTLNSACGGGALTLSNGGNYVLLTTMQTITNRGGFFDATNTVRVQLSKSLPAEVTQTLLANVVTARSLVPEPASWAMLIAGFGLTGAVARRRRVSASA